MSAKENNGEERQALGPSVVLGLVGAVVVLLLLGGGIWGVSKIVSKIRESREESKEEEASKDEEAGGEAVETTAEEGETTTPEEETQDEVAEEPQEETQEEGEVTEEAASEENDEGDAEETSEEDVKEDSEEEGAGGLASVWKANDYKPGDITGDTYTVVWGDTLWEIAEGRYGSGFQWGKIRDANLDQIGFLPNGSRALIFPGQVLSLP
ncbi:LysM peptidoglycan-binding domain-containing protein [Candidatus Dojkabacteria bacterium]|nr:LysM peptidoglycan-binding domain-containing protein [Candidatus Dojkabacteria bacterium]